MNKFAKNDAVGNPNVFYFEELKMDMSPTTLRYIKVLADLLNLFGSLDDMDIIEIGVGYGGQCRIINDIYRPRSYTLVDFKEVLLLSEKYLKEKNIIIRFPEDTTEVHYDLCISNYAFSEMGHDYQIFYADKIIRNSDRGYITCNFIVPENYTKEEIIALKQNYTIYEERPLTYEGNFIYTWK
ncbi:MAG: putative sugar O-methyltransferase [Proteobacteria bacterium]|nr:putative sugar O-methyltransferase [Pseudomonadota bacterium]